METTSYNIELSKIALEVCRRIASSGEEVFVVGGVPRDILLGRKSGDVDLATTATPKKMMTLFSRVIPTGIKHGTVTVLEGDEQFEVTTLRGEDSYSDGRHPDSVTYLRDIEQDLARRDFTVNAIAWDPIRQVLHDPFGGRDDLLRGLLRAVGDPMKRFQEDGLRVLRTARFAATHNFTIEENTAAALPLTANTLGKVAAERKRDELTKILVSDRPSLGLKVMRLGGLLPFVSEDLASVSDGVWSETISHVDSVKPDLWLRLSCLFSHVADSLEDSASLCNRWLKKMCFDRKTILSVPHLIRSSDFHDFDSWTGPDLRRFVKRVGIENVMSVLEIRLAGVGGDGDPTLSSLKKLVGSVQNVLASGHPLSSRDLAISGNDIQADLGVPTGPIIGEIIDALVEHVIDHPNDNQRSILLAKAKLLINSRKLG